MGISSADDQHEGDEGNDHRYRCDLLCKAVLLPTDHDALSTGAAKTGGAVSGRQRPLIALYANPGGPSARRESG